MAKTPSQNQGAFSFFDEVEKVDPLPKPRKHSLKPPAQIEAMEESPVEAVPVVKVNGDQEKEQPVGDAGAGIVEVFPEDTEKKQELETKVFEDQPFIVQEVVSETDQPEFTGRVPAVDDAGAGIVETYPEVTVKRQDLESKVLEDQTFIAEEVVSATDQPDFTGRIPVAEQNRLFERRSTRGRKSVKEHTIAAGMIAMPDDEVLFSKQYYSMGEVTAMFKENHSLIRYWESEFDILKPKKNGKGDRFFRPVDVKNLYLIYDLLRRRKFTIEGAREYLKNNKNAGERLAAVQSLEKIKAFFLELKATL
ncbi:MAG TPA: MerR family transcriptional regulator [Niabella sp.]|nr:MerR family transcriptional regulator [Niabella sp.]